MACRQAFQNAAHLDRAGERIVEIPTAERLQVSRMPVRIALRTLEQEGLLCKTGRGYR
ncbi:GntR family transcriptional regulator, partial [Pseudomonas aeruginosa]|uniref:GntR family transcriptional regulator n=1 Tax=Pseudomonas aeruginosa TaxID=287 RepID=UPI002238CB1C